MYNRIGLIFSSFIDDAEYIISQVHKIYYKYDLDKVIFIPINLPVDANKTVFLNKLNFLLSEYLDYSISDIGIDCGNESIEDIKEYYNEEYSDCLIYFLNDDNLEEV